MFKMKFAWLCIAASVLIGGTVPAAHAQANAGGYQLSAVLIPYERCVIRTARQRLGNNVPALKKVAAATDFSMRKCSAELISLKAAIAAQAPSKEDGTKHLQETLDWLSNKVVTRIYGTAMGDENVPFGPD